MARTIWSKLTGLSEKELEKRGEEIEINPRLVEEEKKISVEKKEENISPNEEWLAVEGQLSIDLYEEGNDLVIKSAIAGVKAEDLDITVEPDLITIRGIRKKDENPKRTYFYQECFWGKFSRTLVLPYPVKPETTKAILRNGILTIILPKAVEKKSSNVAIEE